VTVAVIDRYLEAMQKQGAEAVLFVTGGVVELQVRGEMRAISSRPATNEQLITVASEVLGTDFLTKLRNGSGSFPYRSPFGNVIISVAQSHAGLALKVHPATAAAGSFNAPVVPIVEAPKPPPPPAPKYAAPDLTAVSAGTAPQHIDELFNQMLDMKASDMHLKSGKVPMVRVDGSMTPMPNRPALSADQLWELLEPITPAKNVEEFRETSDSDYAYEMSRARMRCNIFRDIAGVGAVFRQIPTKILTAQQLNLPKSVLDFCEFDKGLVVVTGPTGSGKSTTLAAMIDYINDSRDDHLITIEDPVEFVHKDKRCHINQREVGTHTRGFKAALRAALREDPDIVLVGEMRDLETIAIAIETAETGHLVFGTLHTNTAASTVDRLIDQFPSDRQAQIRTMLSESLKGVVAQTLLKKKGGGRIAALEILVVNHAIANLIREGKTFQIPSIMQTGRSVGMQTLNDALLDLVKSDKVEPQEAYDRSINKKEFGLLLTRAGFKGEWSEGGAA
jgi:twitching motility protein PilT